MVNKYLLDTHTFLWASKEADTFKLSKRAKETLEEIDAELYVSSVSIFEVTNKYRIGKLAAYQSVAENIGEALSGLEARELSLSHEHAELAGNMDWPHKDPFDRMLAAQARTEGLTLISRDKVFEDAPGIETLW